MERNRISYYTWDGRLKEQQELYTANIGDTNGMMVRCLLRDGTVREGFSDPYRTRGEPPYDGSVHDVVYLWTWEHLDEETHRLMGDERTRFDQTFVSVPIHEIVGMDAILYSNPRWGGRLTNRFSLGISPGAEEA